VHYPISGSGAFPMVIQPLLPFCPSPTTVYNPLTIKLRYAQQHIKMLLSNYSQGNLLQPSLRHPCLSMTPSCSWLNNLNTLRSPSPLMQLGLHTSILFAWKLGGPLACSTVSSIAMQTHHHLWNSILTTVWPQDHSQGCPWVQFTQHISTQEVHPHLQGMWVAQT